MRRILVAEDDEEMGELLKFALAAAGYEPLLCPDGVAAWERLQRDGADLALLDVNMPRLDGLELCSRLRADERFRAMPILMLTVRRQVEDQAEGYETGADDYLPKPFDVTVLLARLKALERRLLERA